MSAQEGDGPKVGGEIVRWAEDGPERDAKWADIGRESRHPRHFSAGYLMTHLPRGPVVAGCGGQ